MTFNDINLVGTTCSGSIYSRDWLLSVCKQCNAEKLSHWGNGAGFEKSSLAIDVHVRT